MTLRAMLVLLFGFLQVPASAETVTIRGDAGGDPGFYEVRLGVYGSLGIKVRIDGICASACTILTRLPAQLVCATHRAELRFHKIRPAPDTVVSAARLDSENKRFLGLYPDGIQAWIMRNGGLTDKLLTMPPETVMRYLAPCPPGAVVAARPQ